MIANHDNEISNCVCAASAHSARLHRVFRLPSSRRTKASRIGRNKCCMTSVVRGSVSSEPTRRRYCSATRLERSPITIVCLCRLIWLQFAVCFAPLDTRSEKSSLLSEREPGRKERASFHPVGPSRSDVICLALCTLVVEVEIGRVDALFSLRGTQPIRISHKLVRCSLQKIILRGAPIHGIACAQAPNERGALVALSLLLPPLLLVFVGQLSICK